MTTDLALQALLSADWRRKPKHRVLIHSDQGSQFAGKEWQSFLRKHNLDVSMSRRGNCPESAVAESFFHLLKRERIRRWTYINRGAARQDVFDDIEMFYNPTRKHSNSLTVPVSLSRLGYECQIQVWLTVRGVAKAVVAIQILLKVPTPSLWESDHYGQGFESCSQNGLLQLVQCL